MLNKREYDPDVEIDKATHPDRPKCGGLVCDGVNCTLDVMLKTSRFRRLDNTILKKYETDCKIRGGERK